MTITIYHNPDCGTSRNTLAMIRQSGEEPDVIEYLKTPPSREKLVELIAAMGITAARTAAREGHALCGARPRRSEMDGRRADRPHAGASDPDQPTDRGDAARRRLARPSEAVLDILPNPDIGPFTKEDGEVVIDADGKRVR